MFQKHQIQKEKKQKSKKNIIQIHRKIQQSIRLASSNQDAVKVVRIENSTDLVPLQVGLISLQVVLALGTIWTATLVRRDYRVIQEVRLDPQNTTRAQADAYTEQFQRHKSKQNCFWSVV